MRSAVRLPGEMGESVHWPAGHLRIHGKRPTLSPLSGVCGQDGDEICLLQAVVMLANGGGRDPVFSQPPWHSLFWKLREKWRKEGGDSQGCGTKVFCRVRQSCK